MEGLQLGAVLGAGGFADVYEALEPQLGRRVAVKIFRTRVDGMDRKSFEREAQAMGQLSGVRNVVHVYRSGITDDDHPFLVMERMEYALAALKGNPELTVDHVMHTGAVIGHALQVAHAAGILHRDLKPANILVDRYGEPALSDFGISTVMRSDESSSIYGFSAEHAAPEIFEEARATPAADVYSLGATLFTLIAGHPPFERRPEEGPLAFMTRVMNDPPPSCAPISDTHADLDALLIASMQKDPGGRPDLERFVDDLGQLSGESRDSGVTGDNANPLPVVATSSMSLDPTGSDTVVGSGALKADSESGQTGHDEPGRGPASTKRKKRVLLGAAGVVALAAVVGGIRLTTSDDDGSGPKAEVAGVSQTTGTDTEVGSGDDTPTGAENVRPLGEAGVLDTSGRLSSEIDSWAASTASPFVREATLSQPLDTAEEIGGSPPLLVDYGAFNKTYASHCESIVVHDLAVTGITGKAWVGPRLVLLVNVAEFRDEAAAQQYFWIAALETGIEDAGCRGWPDDGVAIDPGDLSVERDDFGLDVESTESLTAIDDHTDIGIGEAQIAYRSVALVGNRVLLGLAASRADGVLPEQFVDTLEEFIGAVSP